MSQDIVYQCPQCGSPAVEFGELVGAHARCNACKWNGTREDLLGTPFEHMLGSREGIGFELFNDTRRLLSAPVFVVDLGGFLSRWGFIDLKAPRDVLMRKTTRYVAAIARGVLKSIIEEREKIELEETRHARGSGTETPAS